MALTSCAIQRTENRICKLRVGMICLLHFPVVQRLEGGVKMNNKLLVVLIHHDVIIDFRLTNFMRIF